MNAIGSPGVDQGRSLVSNETNLASPTVDSLEMLIQSCDSFQSSNPSDFAMHRLTEAAVWGGVIESTLMYPTVRSLGSAGCFD